MGACWARGESGGRGDAGGGEGGSEGALEGSGGREGGGGGGGGGLYVGGVLMQRVTDARVRTASSPQHITHVM